MTPDNVFVVTFSDEEIELIRRSAEAIGKTFTNVVHDYVMETAERTLEDAVMLDTMFGDLMGVKASRGQQHIEDYERSEKDCMWESDRAGYVL